MMRSPVHWSPATAAALLAALLFGASTPFAKRLLDGTAPVMLAGLLYLGSGIGLGVLRLLRDHGWRLPAMPHSEWVWLLLAIACGGVLAPVLLLLGLAHTSAASASLLLNLEAVLTAGLAWLVFREATSYRIAIGMLLIVAGAALLAWPTGASDNTTGWGAALIALACLCWALDNNFTRKVSATDALFIAGSKGLIAGATNTALALLLGQTLPGLAATAEAMAVGLLAYGISLSLFVVALRGLGTARTGAYFSTAPFLGAALAIVVFGEQASGLFWLVAVLMGIGVWLHLSERHCHVHTHTAITHTHRHVHDLHHQHAHDFPWDGKEPHTHPHTHAPITHCHPHYPDIHHRHSH